ncbi:MAG: tRNA pseudouridine(38-40) synthase TruA [Alphaproteobacteria bacterium]|nr:tRNA pseudouridine(38-40) synthase TruA [Alphaproteobacteria bacterium]
MPRYRLVLEYDGGPFAGFQAQAGQPTVQGALEAAILAFSGEAVRIQAAGRTDAGVHALGQVVHVDLAREASPRTVQRALNAHLSPAPVAVREAALADPAFHARFDALSRRYLYRILNREAPPALERGRVWPFRGPLDVAAMAKAASRLLGQHDFTTFRDAHCQARSPVKTLDRAEVTREGEEVRLIFEARSFLHRQVRSMTGSLVEVGRGRWSVTDFVSALEACDRTACGPVAPAQGLYLASVDYPAAAAPPNLAK